MSKKLWIGVALMVAIIVVMVIALPVLLPPTPGVTYANYSRIEKGMTREEVVAILGRPNLWDDKDTWAWRGDEEDEIHVDVDRTGRVDWLAWNELGDDRTTWEKLRDRMPLIAKPRLAIRFRDTRVR
jgi:outer membrane protein assembly factor BamE (lipoprotein component of BamABCDE complex)